MVPWQNERLYSAKVLICTVVLNDAQERLNRHKNDPARAVTTTTARFFNHCVEPLRQGAISVDASRVFLDPEKNLTASFKSSVLALVNTAVRQVDIELVKCGNRVLKLQICLAGKRLDLFENELDQIESRRCELLIRLAF